MSPRLPRLALWLLSARLTPEWRDFVVGDLEEECQMSNAKCL